MKTLDEVIKANECCDHGEPDSRCEDCPYNGIGACCAERESDALHYLKHLQEYYNMSREHHEPNPALTWAELRTMEGKPVWVEWISGIWKGHRKWVISHGCDDLMMVFTALDVAGASYDGHLRQINLGKTWQAYRKERNERTD